VVTGVGAGLTVIGIGLLAAALSPSYDDWTGESDSSEGMGVAGLVLGAVGLTTVAVGIVLVVTHKKSKRRKFGFVPLIGPRQVGLGFQATF